MDNREVLSTLSFTHPIPKAVRENGRALDPRILEPGDLILVALKVPTWGSSRITKHQGKLFPEEHARWHHAAVSGGRFEICEATIGGVKCREYWKYMTGEFDIRVRRLRDADRATRNSVAFYAATNSRMSYGFFSVLNLLSVLRTGEGWKKPLISTRGMICSQLYFEACMRVGYLLSTAVRSDAVCPAHLSMSHYLDDIPLEWVEV